MNPAIIIVAFNRPASINRLLTSLQQADIPNGTKLIISIDGNGGSDVVQISKDFEWRFGGKEVIERETNLGLRKHVLACGDLCLVYGSIVMLEDDLIVSPHFYTFARKALEEYSNDSRIAGISLYTHLYNVHALQPFTPLLDGSDVFFLQMPSSWGQAWTASQWQGFRTWYDQVQLIALSDRLPYNIYSWPESSWLKYFTKYLLATDSYFVYPRYSLTSNFGDKGTHVEIASHTFQVPLLFGKVEWRFSTLQNSGARYDVFFELESSILNLHAPLFVNADISIDLYGTKCRKDVHSGQVITSRLIDGMPRQFARTLKPHELNIIYNIRGKDFCIAPTELLPQSFRLRSTFNQELQKFRYFHDCLRIKYMYRLLLSLMFEKMGIRR